MSKIVDQFNNLNEVIRDELEPFVTNLTEKVKQICDREDLNGEEIHQIYDHLSGVLQAYAAEQTIMWGIFYRQQEEKERLIKKLGIATDSKIAQIIRDRLSMSQVRKVNLNVSAETFVSLSTDGFTKLVDNGELFVPFA